MLKISVAEPSRFLCSGGWSEIDPTTEWMRRPAAFVLDTSGGVSGQNLTVAAAKLRHSVHSAKISNCVLLSRHHVTPIVTLDGEFHCHEHARYADLLKFHTENQEGKPRYSPTYKQIEGSYYIDFSSTGAVDRDALPGETFLGTPIEPDNWGMWLLNVIPSVTYYLEKMPTARFLCWSRHPWQREFLITLGVRPEQLTCQHPWRVYDVSSLNFLQYSSRDLSPTKSEMASFTTVVDKIHASREFCIPSSIGPRIYVSRSSITKVVGYRALENESLLEDVLRDYGFSILKPEQYSLAQQIAIFQNARVVVGAGGAGMFNSIFCRPGSTVVTIESSAHFIEGHASLFSSLELNYGVIFGRQDQNDKTYVHKRWSVDVDVVVKTVSGL